VTHSTACVDWQERIVNGDSLVPPPIFPKKPKRLWRYSGSCASLMRRQPMIGEACLPWVFDFASCIFGAYDADSGRRLINEFFLLISKKNSKSTIAAAIMLTALIRNWRMSGEFLILAPTVEVAQNSFIPVRDMIKSSPELESMFLIQEHLKTVTHRGTKATLKVIAADQHSVGGKKTIGLLVDELHCSANNLRRKVCCSKRRAAWPHGPRAL